ncbi:MAG: LTA synthase family protein, partial [Anaerotignum sp.]|nr:LTA synthase family protein [Anaerotignum sp.]
MKEGRRKLHDWRLQKAEAFCNSAFGKKLQKLFYYMNKVSLLLHGVWAILINFAIEAMSRHSMYAAWEFSRVSTKAFLYNSFMIFVTFSIVYLFKRRVFARVILTLLWLILGIVNGIMLSRRVTPF